jgi:mono/diheme cytochrome c family protein
MGEACTACGEAPNISVRPREDALRTFGFLLPVSVLVLPSVAGAAAGDAQKGKPLYAAQCLVCHGKTGAGDGPVGKGLTPKPKPFAAGRLLPDEQLFKIIKFGGKANGLSKDMDAYLALSDQQIWDVVAYLKTLAK